MRIYVVHRSFIIINNNIRFGIIIIAHDDFKMHTYTAVY